MINMYVMRYFFRILFLSNNIYDNIFLYILLNKTQHYKKLTSLKDTYNFSIDMFYMDDILSSITNKIFYVMISHRLLVIQNQINFDLCSFMNVNCRILGVLH